MFDNDMSVGEHENGNKKPSKALKTNEEVVLGVNNMENGEMDEEKNVEREDESTSSNPRDYY